jgi:hypothetical protein
MILKTKREKTFFVQNTIYNMCVITPFLPTGFSRVSARKTGQPGPSQHDPTEPRRIKYSQEEGPGHIAQGLTRFD